MEIISYINNLKTLRTIYRDIIINTFENLNNLIVKINDSNCLNYSKSCVNTCNLKSKNIFCINSYIIIFNSHNSEIIKIIDCIIHYHSNFILGNLKLIKINHNKLNLKWDYSDNKNMLSLYDNSLTSEYQFYKKSSLNSQEVPSNIIFLFALINTTTDNITNLYNFLSKNDCCISSNFKSLFLYPNSLLSRSDKDIYDFKSNYEYIRLYKEKFKINPSITYDHNKEVTLN